MTIEEKYAQALFDNLNGWQDRTLARIGRRLKETGRLSAYDQKALKNIVNITGDMNAIYADLARVTGQNIKEVQTAFERFMSDNMAVYKPLYDFRNIPFLPLKDNPIAQQIVNHWVKETAGEMINLSRTKGLSVIKYGLRNGERVPIGVESLQGAYQSAIDKAVFNVTSGIGDFYSNMRDTIEDLGGSGVRIDYGNGVTRSIDSVIRQNMLYAVKQMQTDYDNQIGQELGCDGFEVNFSATCRPSHAFMEGRMFSYSGSKTIDGVTYPDGTEALERLNDYNCHHRKMDVILGVSEPRYNAKEIAEKNKKTSEVIEYDGTKKTRYEWVQKQRAIEREVRKQKTTANMAKAAGDKQLVKDCNTRIKALKAKYNDLTESVGLQKTEERMRVVKPLTSDGKSRNIITGATSGARNPQSEKAIEHANKYYESVRKMKTDTFNIAKNTGFEEAQIRDIKNYIFYDEHDLAENGIRRFFPDFAMAESWQRLINGNIKPHDITMLKHELEEMKLVKLGKTQSEAHNLANIKYNYTREVVDFYGKIKKFKD